MIYNFFFIKFEIFLLFLICYIALLYLCTKFFKLKLNALDFIFISMFFLMLLLRCALDDLGGSHTIYLFNNFIIYNDFIKLLKICMTLFFFVYLIIVYNFNNVTKTPIIEYLILIFLCFFSLNMIIISNHLFVIFLFLEIVNICLYCLIGLNKNSNKGIEAAYKYFIQSSFATIIGFFAISLIYALTGTLFLNELFILFNDINLNIIIKFSLLALISTILFKLGLFPLHSWIPDVYQGSYLVVMLFIATLPKFTYISLFLKVFLLIPNFIFYNYCLYIALFSILYGSIIALYQINFKRLLAYGSMVHMGFILYSLSLCTPNGIAAAVFYLIIYIILIIFVFSFMFFLLEENDGNFFFIDDISRLYYLLNKNKLLSLFFAYIILSLAGLPFFIGFISKWYIFVGLLIKNQFIDLIILIGVSVLSSAYYIRLIRFLFFIENKDKKVKFHTIAELSKSFYFLIIFLFILNILIIFYHNWIYLYILKCVLSLFS